MFEAYSAVLHAKLHKDILSGGGSLPFGPGPVGVSERLEFELYLAPNPS